MSSILNSIVVSIADLNVFTTTCVFVFTFLLIFYSTRRKQGVPPGPPLFPVIGNLPSLIGGDMFKMLADLRQKYGDIFGLYIGRELTVFLNGYDVVNDALIKKGSLFVNRPNTSFHKMVIKHPAIIFANGQLWKEQRTFTQKALQVLCFSNNGTNIEHIINKEIAELVNEISAMVKVDKAVDLKDNISISTANVVFTVVYKHRFGFNDCTLISILNAISEGASEFANMTVMINCLPFLSRLPGDLMKIRKTEMRRLRVDQKLKPYIEAIKQKNELSDSAIGLYLKQIKGNKENGVSNTINEEKMEHTCFEFLAAGSETTATTLRWVILFLIRQPEVQNKMFEEIVTAIGKDAAPTLKDRKRLPYAQATVLEALRIAPAAPLAVPHTVSRDVVFRGYVIPENSTVMINLYSCLKDPEIWDDPNEFRPERFLSKDGTELLVPKDFVSFSLGPRSCPGETLARIELFLFLVTLVQKFEFYPAVDGCVPNIKGTLGLTWSPDPFLVKITKR